MSTPATGLWQGDAPLLLASTSPVRHHLLAKAGILADREASGLDERALQAKLESRDPAIVAARLAEAKAAAVSTRRPGRVVVGADQVLEIDGAILNKAADREEAIVQLVRLAGRTHMLHSAVTIARDRRILWSHVGQAALTMRPLERAEIERYADLVGEVATRSVGGYEIEGVGLHLFDRVEGDMTTIMGLPMMPLLAALRGLGLLAFGAAP